MPQLNEMSFSDLNQYIKENLERIFNKYVGENSGVFVSIENIDPNILEAMVATPAIRKGTHLVSHFSSNFTDYDTLNQHVFNVNSAIDMLWTAYQVYAAINPIVNTEPRPQLEQIVQYWVLPNLETTT